MISGEQVHHEIVRIHRFFVGWYRGEWPADAKAFETEFTDVLAPDLQYIMPSGVRLTADELIQLIRDGRGSNPNFDISIENVKLLANAGDGICVVTYVENQSGAANSPQTNSRYSVALLQHTTDGFLWKFIQETACPHR